MHLSALLRTSRPRFWFYTLGPTILGLAAAQTGEVLAALPVAIAALVYATFPANLLIYGVNDIFDYETDVQNAKKQGYEDLVPPDRRREVAVAIAVTNIPFLAFLSYVAPTVSLAWLVGFLFLGVFYSAPPLRFKTKPFLDSASNVLYALPGFFAWSAITAQQPLATGVGITALVAALLWCAAMHAFSAAPDIAADRAAGMHTIATVLGARGTIVLCLALYVTSAVLLSLITIPAAGYLGGIYAALMGSAYRVDSDHAALMRVYARFPLINVAVGFALFLILALS